MKLKNKRGSELVTNKLIILVLVVLVVLTILIFAFRSDTLSWIKNLPGFKPAVDSEIDLTKISPSELANMGYTCEGDDDIKVGIIGPRATGNFLYQTVYDVRYLYMFDVNDFKNQGGLNRVGVEVDISDLNAKTIDLTEGANINVGTILGRAVLINQEMYNNNSANTQKVLKYINATQLRRLDGSYTVGGNLICKNKTQIIKEGQAVPLYYSGFNLVPEGKLLRIYKDGKKTKFYRDGNYIRYEKFGWDTAIFSVDNTGRTFYTKNGAESIEKIKTDGDGILLEDLRKSIVKDNTLVHDDEMDSWDVVGRIVYEERPNTWGKEFYVDLVTGNNVVTPTNLYFTDSINGQSSQQGLMLSSAGKSDELVPVGIIWTGESTRGIIGTLQLNLNQATYLAWKQKDYPDLIDYEKYKSLEGLNYNFGKQVIYKIKTVPVTPVIPAQTIK